MKQITVSTMTTKDGSNDHGPWVNHRIKDTDGNGWTTFADEGKTITEGAVLEVEPKMKDGVPVMKDNRMRFDKFTIVTAGAAAPAGGSPTNGDDPDKRLSIERQSSAASLLRYGASMYGNNMTGDETTAVNKAIAWLSSRFDDVPASEPADDIVRTDRINAAADRAAESAAAAGRVTAAGAEAPDISAIQPVDRPADRGPLRPDAGGTVGMVDHWGAEIVDEDLIPREWMQPHLTKINLEARERKGGKVIPGVKWVNNPTPSVR